MNNTATPRQRFALYCITKKDYRNVKLSKEEADKLIKELGNPNYKKESKPSKDIKTELLDFLKAHIDELYNDCLEEMGYESQVTISSTKQKTYTFVGRGCGITYLKYRKNNKKAVEIDNAAHKYRLEEVEQMLIKKLPKKIYKELEAKGCPFEALWCQMQTLQMAYWYLIKDFAETKGIKMTVESYLD